MEEKEREPLFLKPSFPNCGATKHNFRRGKVYLRSYRMVFMCMRKNK